MNYKSTKQNISGTIIVPGSKSHTIRALLLAALAEGVSHIKNPLPSADCLSAAHAIKAFGAQVDIGCPVDEKGLPCGTPADTWIVTGAGKNAHLPKCQIDVGNSGSTLYFFTPVAARPLQLYQYWLLPQADKVRLTNGLQVAYKWTHPL